MHGYMFCLFACLFQVEAAMSSHDSFQLQDGDGRQKRMSKGKKIGIAVVVILLLAAVIAVIVYFAAFHNKVLA